MRTTRFLVLGLSILSSLPGRALDKTYGKLPMSFEKNFGQGGAGADFVARGSGYSVFLAPGEAVLALKKQKPLDRPSNGFAGNKERAATIRMTLVGSGPARAAAEDQLPGKVNYFLGNDATKWRRDLPTFAKVRYPGVYPGIDVVYYGNQGRLEYDFIVTPGADPKAIALAFTGARIDIERTAISSSRRRPALCRCIGPTSTRRSTGQSVRLGAATRNELTAGSASLWAPTIRRGHS